MKSSTVPAGGEYSVAMDVHASGPEFRGGIDSLVVEEIQEESSLVPLHPLGLKPAGNQYTATSNARHRIGDYQVLPDEVLAITLEYLNSVELRLLGSTCKFLYAFCRSDDLWKILFIE